MTQLTQGGVALHAEFSFLLSADAFGLRAAKMERTQTLVQKGLVPTRSLAEATLMLRTLETELAKVQLDLAVIRDRLQQLQQAR